MLALACHAPECALQCVHVCRSCANFDMHLCLHAEPSVLACADHGLYAHQTPTFDSFSASQEFPMHITEHSTSSSYKLVGEVAGVLKMTG